MNIGLPQEFNQSPNNSKPTVLSPVRKFNIKLLIFLLIGILFAVIIAASLIFIFTKLNKPNKPVLKVGIETLYQKDLDFELAQFPPQANVKKEVILEKMVSDSLTLQIAGKEGLVKLNPQVFNSPQKDYPERVKSVKTINEKINQKVNSISGAAIVIFFVNGEIGPLGYEKSKELAFSKISKLHEDVKKGEITIYEAAEEIKNDSSLEQIDKSYKSNALLKFKSSPGQKVTISDEFNKTLTTLETGEVSDIITGQIVNSANGYKIDGFYIFGIIEDRQTSFDANSFSDWLNGRREEYEVKYL